MENSVAFVADASDLSLATPARVNDANIRQSYDSDDSSLSTDEERNIPKNLSGTESDASKPSEFELQGRNRKFRKSGRQMYSHNEPVHYQQPSNLEFPCYQEQYTVNFMPQFSQQQQQPLTQAYVTETVAPQMQVDFVMQQDVIQQSQQSEQEKNQEEIDKKESKRKSMSGNFASCFIRENFTDYGVNNCSSLEPSKIPCRASYYHFDYGNSEFLRTTDPAPQLASDKTADKFYHASTKFWAEIFGGINILITFVITFFLQFYRFILYSIFRTIIVGLVQMTADYLFKPILIAVFNGIVQPIFLLFLNIFQLLWRTLEPLSEMFMGFSIPIIELVRAFRIVDVKSMKNPSTSSNHIV